MSRARWRRGRRQSDRPSKAKNPFFYPRFEDSENSVEKRWDEIRRIADLRPTDEVIDLGCAEGLITLEVAGFVGHVRGVDISPERIAEARRIARERGIGNATFEVASIVECELRPFSYDVSIFMAVWGKPAGTQNDEGEPARTIGELELDRVLRATRRQALLRINVQSVARVEPRLAAILDLCDRNGFDALCFSRPLHDGRYLRGNMIIANRRGTDAGAGELPPLVLMPTSIVDHVIVRRSSTGQRAEPSQR
jgi:SAM-dependent methyltransferase